MSNGNDPDRDPGNAAPDRSRQLRRWAPVGAIVVVVALVVGVLVVSSGGGDDGGSDTDVTTGSTSTLGANTVSFSQAQEQGTVDQIDWGDRCDTERGTLAYPDYFAQECFAPFEGDNGGATAKGVTADSIEIVYYLAQDDDPILAYIMNAISGDDTNAQEAQTMRDFVEFFEHYFETYGRHVDLHVYTATGVSNDEVTARADAKAIADMDPFMVWGGPVLAGEAFSEVLAENHVAQLALGAGTAAFMQSHDPYLVAIPKSAEQSRVLLAEYVGKRLAGRKAVHSPDFADRDRKFAYLYLETSEQSTTIADAFRAQLADEYDVDLADVVPYELDPTTIQETAANKIAKLKSDGVTSVIFAGDPIAPKSFTEEATAQDYFPEWVMAGTALVDTEVFGRTYDQQQWAHAFGMSNLAARTSREVAGAYFLHRWYFGEAPPADDTVGLIAPYPQVFYSVIQGIGPDLTPRNFVDGLFAAPATSRGALTQPSLSWGSKGLWPDALEPDYMGIDDVTEIWWNPDATGPDEIGREGTGMYEFVDGGKRYLPGEWPATDSKAFDPDGAVTIYTERPASETPPSYPSPAG